MCIYSILRSCLWAAVLLVLPFVEPVAQNAVVISEINYNSEPSIDAGDWVELYNSGNNAVSIGGWVLRDVDITHTYTLPAGTVLAPGARVVLVNDALKFAQQHPNVPYLGTFAYSFNNTSDQVNLYDNFNSLLHSVTYIDSLPWPRGADGTGRSLELLDATQPLNNPANWFDGCVGGSPGQAYTPCNDAVFFAEINYNSDSLLDADDWVELRNGTNAPIDLSGWKFYDKQDTNVFVIPTGTVLPPLGNIVLAQTANKFACIYPNTAIVGSFLFNLSGDGELLRLYDNTNKLRFSVVYDDNPQTNWTALADGEGYTLEVLDENGKMNEGSNWFAGCLGGSPALPYSPSCPNQTALVVQGNSLFCKNTVQTYSIPPLAGVSNYVWTVQGGSIVSGQGTNTVQVQWGTPGTGTIMVVGE